MTQNEILTTIIGSAGWLLATLQAIFGYYERRKTQNDLVLLNTVEYFTGGTQKRSVGISLIEGLVKQKKDYDNIVVPLLTNQFVYLLLSTDTESAVHEERNLIRIYLLLKEIIKKNRDQHWHSRNEILEAILRRQDYGEKSSLKITSQTLKIWQEELN